MASERQINNLPSLHAVKMIRQQISLTNRFTHQSTTLTNERRQCCLRKPEDRSTVAASLNKDLARIQEWLNHWCMILNPNKTMALVVSRSRAVNPPHDDLVLSGVSIRANPYLDILGMKLTASSPSKTMSVVLFPVSLRELVF